MSGVRRVEGSLPLMLMTSLILILLVECRTKRRVVDMAAKLAGEVENVVCGR
jgi:hypothetical protein